MAKSKKEDVETKVEEKAVEQEQGFDEEELKDIMEEIDSLEQEFSEDEEAPQPVASKEDSDQAGDDPLAEVNELTEGSKGQSGQLDEVAGMSDSDDIASAMDELESVICENELDDDSEVVPMRESSSIAAAHQGETHADFSVSGSMSLSLNVTVNGQLISLEIDPEAGVTIEMEHGAKFTLPINNKQAA
jgi:hypothetical protein